MIVSDELVARYFAPPREPLWRWSNDGAALITMGGKTIAFKAEVERVLERLAPRGLPPFGAVVLLLAACRDRWSEDVELRGAIAQLSRMSVKSGGAEVAQAVDAIVGQRVAVLLGELDRINNLHTDLRRTPDGKAFLAETIFETVTRPVKPADAEAIIGGLKRGIPKDMLQPVSYDGADSLLADLDVLHQGIKLSGEQLALRQKTGLDELPLPAEPDAPLPDRACQLLEALRSDNDVELSGLARLALDLLAAVHVPRLLTQRDELPLGGFTDISNRGHLDRLLLSELAHDDLTLSVRIALNEALYLRREAPPRHPPQHREILIDSGIRMWGLPRAFAASVALAFVATADRNCVTRCFRAGETAAGRVVLTEIQLATRQGLTEQLGALEPAPHPGPALKEFLAASQEQQERPDTILITHPDVLDDPDFKSALSAIPELNLYIASVDREGQFRLLHFTPVGHTVVREALFPLESIFAPKPEKRAPPQRPPAVPLKDKQVDPNLPVILSLDEFPLLLPHPINPKRCRVTAKGVLYAVTHDGRLMRRESLKTGSRQLSDKVPPGGVRKVLVEGEMDVFVLIDPHRERKLTLFHAIAQERAGWTQRTRTVTLEGRKETLLEAFMQNGLLVIIYSRWTDVYNPGTGKRLFTYEHWGHGRMWANGRFFYNLKKGKTFYQLALSTPSGRVALIEHPVQDCVALIERPGETKGLGPWALKADGTLAPALQGEAIKFELRGNKIIRVLAVSDDGNQLKVEFAPGKMGILDVPSRTVNASIHPKWVPLDSKLIEYERQAQIEVRSHIQSVGLTEGDRTLALRTRTGTYGLKFIDEHDRFELIKRDGSILSPESFSRCTRPEGTRYGLYAARFQDGSHIYLDSRGMLHLKSSDKNIPEMTLVLHDKDVAYWCSNGEVMGAEFFLPGGMKRAPGTAFKKINAFLGRLK